MPIYGFKTSKRSKNSPIVNISPKLTLFENLYEYKFVPQMSSAVMCKGSMHPIVYLTRMYCLLVSLYIRVRSMRI